MSEPPTAASLKVVITNRRGLHARAAAKFVREAERFKAALTVTKDDTTVAGTSILGLMMLAAGQWTVLRLDAAGEDAQAAIAALTDLVRRGFDED